MSQPNQPDPIGDLANWAQEQASYQEGFSDSSKEELKSRVNQLMLRERLDELDGLQIGKQFVGPNGESGDFNIPDHDAIWNRITERRFAVQAQLVEAGGGDE